MIDRIQEIQEAAAQAVDRAGSSEELERVRIEYLGRKAELPQLLRGVAQLPPEERGRVGKAANQARGAIEGLVEESRHVVNGTLAARLGDTQRQVAAAGDRAEVIATSFARAVAHQREAFDLVLNG